jgi:phosphoenolpyruvate phosphomutase
MSKSVLLRNLINSDNLEFLMEAHNGISAKIVEKTGFKGIWASGLTISSSLGLRDCNEASFTQVLQILEYMNDATSLPILVDGDTGYGDFNTARRFVRKLEQIGIAGVCFEDKIFPKTNSFIEVKGGQKLADIREFCGKIRACKDAQSTKDFVVVARIEAFISGLGLEEALIRAKAYQQAGADAVLVHSKIKTCQDIDDFMQRWDNSCPVVIVPTTYHMTPTEHFKEIGCSLVIWANHNMRASIKAIEDVSKQIFENQNIQELDDKIKTVKDIFEYTKEAELKEDEKKYMNYVKLDQVNMDQMNSNQSI